MTHIDRKRNTDSASARTSAAMPSTGGATSSLANETTHIKKSLDIIEDALEGGSTFSYLFHSKSAASQVSKMKQEASKQKQLHEQEQRKKEKLKKMKKMMREQNESGRRRQRGEGDGDENNENREQENNRDDGADNDDDGDHEHESDDDDEFASKMEKAQAVAQDKGVALEGLNRKQRRAALQLTRTAAVEQVEQQRKKITPKDLMDPKLQWYQQGPYPLDEITEKLVNKKALKHAKTMPELKLEKYNYQLIHPSWLAARQRRRYEMLHAYAEGTRTVFAEE